MRHDQWAAEAAGFCTDKGQGPAVMVALCGARGWDCRRMTLAQYGRARANLERLEILSVYLIGALA